MRNSLNFVQKYFKGGYSWILMTIVSLLMFLYSYYNLIFIQNLDADDPDFGWDWLTTDPEIIEYIKFQFLILGFWVLAISIIVFVISITGFRKKERWAWFSLLYLPIHIGIHFILWPWTIGILAIPFILTILSLILSYREIFVKMKSETEY